MKGKAIDGFLSRAFNAASLDVFKAGAGLMAGGCRRFHQLSKFRALGGTRVVRMV